MNFLDHVALVFLLCPMHSRRVLSANFWCLPLQYDFCMQFSNRLWGFQRRGMMLLFPICAQCILLYGLFFAIPHYIMLMISGQRQFLEFIVNICWQKTVQSTKLFKITCVCEVCSVAVHNTKYFQKYIYILLSFMSEHSQSLKWTYCICQHSYMYSSQLQSIPEEMDIITIWKKNIKG